jgi:hypothetical protein
LQLKYSPEKIIISYLLSLFLLFSSGMAFAQPTTSPTSGMPNKPLKDTSKTNTGKWRDDPVTITYQKLNSAKTYIPDTALHTYQRPPFTQPWYRDLGNLGSPVNNLLFTPEERLGPSLGYHVMDVYRYNIEDLKYYTTSRPYSSFNYELGSKLEQTASLMHTQNVKPNWNFAIEYRKTNSPGFYEVQRNNHDNANITTNYKSLDKHYVLYAAMVYNHEQHDENGGVLDSELIGPSYSDRKTIATVFGNSTYSTLRSPVTNVQRDFTFLVQHSYLFGKTDTIYNEDSTHFTYKLKPVFSITHKMEISTEKHTYKDVKPDSTRYVDLFHQSFTAVGTGFYSVGGDSVITQQKWAWIDNQVLLNGFIGNADHPLEFSAGLGNRYDQFASSSVLNLTGRDTFNNPVYHLTTDKSSILSNYLVAEIKKEALHPGEWEYGANTKFFLTGQDADNLLLNASMGRELRGNTGSFVMGFQQRINSAPYNYTNYENNYIKHTYNLNNESVTMLYATIESQRFLLSGGVRNYVIGNYIYLNDSEKPSQYTIPFTISQAWVRKTFRIGNFLLDNELVYQQIPVNAPVNIPALMGRHQFSYEHSLFKHALKVAVGVEVRYNSNYKQAGYDPLLNRFFYQNTAMVKNKPEANLFFNFRIKRFRAFIMGENLQQLINGQNTVLFLGSPGTNFVYAAPDALIRFGFSWVMVN